MNFNELPDNKQLGVKRNYDGVSLAASRERSNPLCWIMGLFRKKGKAAPEKNSGDKSSDVNTIRGKRKKKKKSYGRETAEIIVIAILLALFIRTFVVQAFKIPSSSMENTLLVGDHILVSKFAYGLQVPKPSVIGWTTIRLGGVSVFAIPIVDSSMKPVWGEIERGDVIVFRYPKDRVKDYIKRVIGLPGDTVEVRSNKVYINGRKIDEPYAIFKGSLYFTSQGLDNFGPYKVPEGNVFAMGDNRDRSSDGRVWGPVPIGEIKGKAFMIYWSRDPSLSWPSGIRTERFADGIK